MFIPALDQSTPHVHSAAAATDTYLGNIHLAWMVSQNIASNTRLGNIHLAWIVSQNIPSNTHLGNIHLAWMVSQHIASNTRLGNIHLAWMVKQNIFPATWTESGRSSCSGSSSPYTLTYGSSVAENVDVGAVLSITDEGSHLATYTYTVTAISADGTQVTMNYTSDGGVGLGDDSPCDMIDEYGDEVAGTYTNP